MIYASLHYALAVRMVMEPETLTPGDCFAYRHCAAIVRRTA
jgi:hypothetical protein